MFRNMVACSNQGIIGIDSEGKISVFNNSAERLLGLVVHQAVGKTIQEILPGLQLGVGLKKRKAIPDMLVHANNRNLIVSIIPLDTDVDDVVAMITIEDGERIAGIEAAIRSEIFGKKPAARHCFEDILGVSKRMKEAKRIAREYAAIDAAVLITGPSGTGKKLYAESIHNASSRWQRPFVAVNCRADSSLLIEKELFGSREGSVDDVENTVNPGLFELAHGGTIFFDEIGEMNEHVQAGLLGVMKEQRVIRRGGETYLPVDVRIIASTGKDPLQLVRNGMLREDLYHRINALQLKLPVLSDCPGDALLIAEHFLKATNKRFHKNMTLDENTRTFIASNDWPGNVRELKNYIEQLVLTSENAPVTAALPRKMSEHQREYNVPRATARKRDSDKALIFRVLIETNYNQQKAAKRLGMDRSTLYRKLKALNIKVKKLCSPTTENPTT